MWSAHYCQRCGKTLSVPATVLLLWLLKVWAPLAIHHGGSRKLERRLFPAPGLCELSAMRCGLWADPSDQPAEAAQWVVEATLDTTFMCAGSG
jgi:hypothetical protein